MMLKLLKNEKIILNIFVIVKVLKLKKKAFIATGKAIDKITGEVTGVTIWKTFLDGWTIPQYVFKYGNINFHKVDKYLNKLV